MWKNRKGFTLIELLISIAVMAVLSAGVVSMLGQGSRQYSRDVRRQSDINAIATALALYRNDNGRYPGAGELTAQLVSNYMTAIPTDPQNGTSYTYAPLPAGCTVAGTRCVSFTLCDAMEKMTPSPYCVNSQ